MNAFDVCSERITGNIGGELTVIVWRWMEESAADRLNPRWQCFIYLSLAATDYLDPGFRPTDPGGEVRAEPDQHVMPYDCETPTFQYNKLFFLLLYLFVYM